MKILNKKYSKISLILLFIVATIFISKGLAKNYVKNFIEKKTPSTLDLKFSDIEVNILFGNITFHNAILKMKSQDSLAWHTSFMTKSIHLEGISYWDILVVKKLSLQSIKIDNPIIKYYPYRKTISNKEKKTIKNDGIRSINSKDFTITKGIFNVMRKSEDSIQLSIPSFDLKIINSQINLDSNDAFPLQFDNYQFNGKNMILGNTKYATVKTDSLYFENKSLTIINLQIVPKYDKKELSKHLKKERDYIDLKIPKIVFDQFDFNFKNKRFGITAEIIELTEPNLEIYRDKLLADDLTVKPLYSKSLRNLSFDLNSKELKIKNGYISYAELVESDKSAGKLFFDKINASLYEISNLKEAKKTEIKVKSRLMGVAPLELNWSFDVNNSLDAFSVTGSVQHLDAPVLNSFFKPNLNAVVEGTLEQMYFSFNGNTIRSKGEIKMKYEDFNFKILKKNSNKVNKFLTVIGNIFVRDDSKSDPNDFRSGEIEAERDSTKSFFNYLWINVKSGIVKVLTTNKK